jgi:phosphoribosylglycinamide formyltransferase 1
VRLGVLVSGTGSILESLLEADLPVSLVVADRPCRGLEIAQDAGAAAELVDRRSFGGFGDSFDREAYTRELVKTLARHGVDLVAMAGFGTVLSQEVHDAYPGRILNTHPALLPSFPGWHAVEDALRAGVQVTGCTVHLAALEMDTGPVLAQEEVPVLPGDTVDTLHERIKQVERRLYPATVRQMLEDLNDAGGADQATASGGDGDPAVWRRAGLGPRPGAEGAGNEGSAAPSRATGESRPHADPPPRVSARARR